MMQHTSSTFALPKNIDPSWRIAIVHSSYYEEEMTALVKNARDTLRDAGVSDANIAVHPVAGSFEIPLVGAALARAKVVDGLIGIGIVVQGETHHAELIAANAARGMMDVQVQYGVPFAFEILYVQSLEDAQKRAEGEGNKGAEAARSVLHSLDLLRGLKS
jgi:6,7-dimethyl-8-ribityllumazine synthase